MNTNQTIDGVPRSLLQSLYTDTVQQWGVGGNAAGQLRALLDAEPSMPSQREPVTMDGKTTIREYVANSVPEDQIGDDWTKGYEECKRRIHRMFQQPVNTEQPASVAVAQKYDDTLLPFVALMRTELHANAGKGDRPGWLAMSSDTCLLEIIYHFGKLQASVKRGDCDGMAEYAADVANMCMMLLDICKVLPGEQGAKT